MFCVASTVGAAPSLMRELPRSTGGHRTCRRAAAARPAGASNEAVPGVFRSPNPPRRHAGARQRKVPAPPSFVATEEIRDSPHALTLPAGRHSQSSSLPHTS